MLKGQIEMERSPFHKQRNMKAPRGSENIQTQVSQDMFEDFMKYARHYNAEHPTDKGLSNKANPLKHIINEFLNTHALERKCFEDLHVIMLMSNPFDYMLRKYAVIGFVRHPEKFTKFHPFRITTQRQYDSGIVYGLEEFNKQTFDMLNLNRFDREVLFNINPSIYGDFEKVKTALQEQHTDIDFDDAFVVMFNLNNYFDILQDGVYNSIQSRDKHDGAIVLCNPDYKLEVLCVLISWSYHNKTLDIEFHVEEEGSFRLELSDMLPPAPYHEFWSISTGFLQADISKLEMSLREKRQSIETHKDIIETKERQIKRIERRLEKLKQ